MGSRSLHLFAADRFAFENWSSLLEDLVQRRAGVVNEMSKADEEEDAARVLQKAAREHSSWRSATLSIEDEAAPAVARSAIECS